MNVHPLRLKKCTYFSLLFVVVLVGSLSGFSQGFGHARLWKAIVYTDSPKVKGILYQVSDSSVVLVMADRSYNEISFSTIHKIKLRPRFGKMEKVVGFLVGAGTGAAVLASAAGRGREGEPATMAGIFSGFTGFLVGGGIGIAVATPVYRLIFTKKYIVQHEPSGYARLSAKLRRRCVKR